MPSFFARLDGTKRAAAALIVCIALGVAIGVAIAEQVDVPTDVRRNSATVAALDIRVTALEAARTADAEEARRTYEGLGRRLDRLECLVIAGRRGTPIEDCLSHQ